MSSANPTLDFESRLKVAQSQVSTDPSGALSSAQDLLEERSDPRVIRVIAEAQRGLGNSLDAEATDLMAIRASGRDPQLRQATLAIQQGRWDQGTAIAGAYIESSPGDLLALTILSEALVGLKRSIEAERTIRPVIEKVPSFSRAHLVLGKSLILQCRMNEAIDVLAGSLRTNPENPEILELLIESLVSVGRFEQAIQAHEKLLSLEHAGPDAWVSFAATLRFAGRQSDALDALNRALSIDRTNGQAWWAIANMAPATIGAPEMAVIEGALGPSRDHEKASLLHVALATALDRSGEFERAFDHFLAGKNLRKEMTRYDPRVLEADVDAALRLFDKQFFAQRANLGADDASPIFIIGLPRSGSTLVERILGGHSRIEASGELPIIFRLVDQLDAEVGQRGGYRPLVAQMHGERANDLGQWYAERSREFRHTAKPFFTDKLHLNWLHLPLIRLILPKARIIDVRRNTVDCCWANFKIIFASGHPASNDLEDLASLYRDYVRMMDQAASWADGRILNVRYEAVVENVEAETRRMLEFLGLEYEEACLNFHQLDTPVATISAEQVRKPLNREGIGRWKPYRQWLGPLFDALGPLAENEA